MDGMNDGKRIVIAGGTGFLGQALAVALEQAGFSVVVLGRHRPVSASPDCFVPSENQDTAAWGRFVPWDGRTIGDWAGELDGADAIVNLAGRTVDCVKTPANCDEILRSRVESTRALGQACAERGITPRVWVQMSTAHIVGDPPTVVCDEDSPPGYGLAPDVGRAWEAEFHATKPEETRGVILRTSFVLDSGKGAMKRLGLLARVGLGGTVGHGRQGISWIHVGDMNRLFLRAIEDETMQGVYMATAPNPVSNREFMRALRQALGMPIGLPAPAFGVKIAARLLLRTDPELALEGRYCVSRRLEDEGFEFQFETILEAFADLYGN
ncbi:MAG: DUF1731 domain-containing protein [Planctomycetota bacterium]